MLTVSHFLWPYTTLNTYGHSLAAKSCLTFALWTVAHQAPLSIEFSRQEYWSKLPFPPPGDLPDPGVEPSSLCLLHWPVDYYYFFFLGGFFITVPPGYGG